VKLRAWERHVLFLVQSELARVDRYGHRAPLLPEAQRSVRILRKSYLVLFENWYHAMVAHIARLTARLDALVAMLPNPKRHRRRVLYMQYLSVMSQVYQVSAAVWRLYLNVVYRRDSD
jgi:hypothetical protein